MEFLQTILSLKPRGFGVRGGVCVLFTSRTRCLLVLDTRTYRREIGLISQSGSILGWSDVSRLFGGENLTLRTINSKWITVGNQELELVARVGNTGVGNPVVEVWIEESEDDGSPASSTVSTSTPPIDSSNLDNMEPLPSKKPRLSRRL
jgi:hypothetical protein